ncbi:MAG: hypothetical protein K8J08_20780 [Thermoanaerobaculia bacterium]|nr:hypothetical protein [Thermoanaerobaculia bacterium]
MTKTQSFLNLYAGVLTIVFAATVLMANAPKVVEFDEITTQRINVVEPDGTLRMVLSNHAKLPGIIARGEEKTLDRPQAGIIFYNDEASEIGGLIFGGRRNSKGEVVDSGGSLSFDRYEANQVVQLIGVDDKNDRFAGLAVLDSPSGNEVHRRIWLGRGDDGNATLALLDANGRKRLVLLVTPEGKASVSVLDQDGKPIQQLLPVD